MALGEGEAQARTAFGEVLARLRAARGWSQVDLRDALAELGVRVTPAYLGMWETGRRAPGAEHVAALEQALNAPGLGLVLGIDSGTMARLVVEVDDLRARVDRIEASRATKRRRKEGAAQPPTPDPEAAIAADERLDDEQKHLLVEMLRAELARRGPSTS